MQINKLKKYSQFYKLAFIQNLIEDLNDEGDIALLEESYNNCFRLV